MCWVGVLCDRASCHEQVLESVVMSGNKYYLFWKGAPISEKAEADMGKHCEGKEGSGQCAHPPHIHMHVYCARS